MYFQSYIKEATAAARYAPYHKSRSPLLPGAHDQSQIQAETLDDPLELRRIMPGVGAATTTTGTPLSGVVVGGGGGLGVGGRPSITIPQSLQSPGDRSTGKH